MHLFGFIIRKFVTMHGHTNVKFNYSSSCSVEVKNDCSYMSPSHICLYGLHGEHFIDAMDGKQTAK
jgi:hypothetical protein